MIAMAQAVTLLTVLQTFNAQRTCESGSPVLERYSKSAFNKGYDMIKSDLSPEAVLSKCREHCNVNPGLCTGFSFKPGKWIGTRWEDSSCVFSKDKFIQGGINYERAYEMEYFNQICLNRGRMEEVCNNRTYAFTVYPDMEVVLNDTSIVQARDRIDCMDKCLAEERFTCRSAIYDRNGVCHISRFSSSNMKSMRGSYFMENECLHGLSRCEGFTQYIMEENANIVNSRVL
ncbi:uncharacterized protein LOC111714042 [Eurytemora carolleeae]|uniref:uncharacterized protein LOC111714042 n=1 Tax=Eurytemora carolleeae TaxID=1294199 RepID=UPI000C786467|nr:uncharacterized protein LOC111714042 [Eurytemora carolleeae]|eukprot:XP_023344812.1 uncharacterized protein LOC111714042 [Eurytemora affinis]